MTTNGARAQLQSLVREVAGGGRAFANLPPQPRPTEPREASVLMLFGMLDDHPSDHDAQALAVSRDLDVLLLARATTLRAHAGQVAFPGGRRDPQDAGPIDAALREAREETGLRTDGVDVLGVLERVPLAFSGHIVTPVLGWWTHPSSIRVVDEGESSDVFRIPVADLLDPKNRGVTVLHRGGSEWRGPAFAIETTQGSHTVWGFTAMLLDGLFNRLGWSEPWDAAREMAFPQ